jgi:hypothetical protein
MTLKPEHRASMPYFPSTWDIVISGGLQIEKPINKKLVIKLELYEKSLR